MGAQASQEPSMEDILSSIRKIIAEDDQFETLESADTDDSGRAALSPNTENGSNRAEAEEAVKPSVQIPHPDQVPQDLAQQSASLESNFGAGNEQATAQVEVDPITQVEIDNFDAALGKSESDSAESRAVFDKTVLQASSNTSGTGDTFTPVFANVPETPIEKPPQETPILEEQVEMSQTDNSNLHPAIMNAMAYQQNAENVEPAAIAVEKPVFETAVPMASSDVGALVSPADDSERRVEERRIHPLRREADMDEEFSNALISTKTDEAVTNSFEQLKMSTVENLDSDVQAMLRPMLREWLDSNLPSMVERLVRDEIERVSRGE